jgi:hypothetical protein
VSAHPTSQLTGEVLDLEPDNAIPVALGFPIVARARCDGRELIRLPGLDKHEDLALLHVIATDKTGPVDAYDVRDPDTVLWSSDLPSWRETLAEAVKQRDGE